MKTQGYVKLISSVDTNKNSVLAIAQKHGQAVYPPNFLDKK